MRARTSLVPAAGYGIRNFTGLVGYAPCANAVLGFGAETIERTKMQANVASHRTMGILRRARCASIRDEDAKVTASRLRPSGAGCSFGNCRLGMRPPHCR